MSLSPSFNSLNSSAKLVGIAYLFTFTIVVFANFAIYNKLVVPGNVVETARTIASSEWLFRTGILFDLAYAAGFIVLSASLYSIFKETNSNMVRIAIMFHMVYIIVWVAVTLTFFYSLRLVGEAKYLQVFSTEQSAALAKLFLNARFDRYYGPLMFYTVGSTIYALLWYRSGFIPKFLSMWGIVACVWCTLCAVAYLANPDFGTLVNPWLFDLPMALFDITLSFWLLTRGLKQTVNNQ